VGRICVLVALGAALASCSGAGNVEGKGHPGTPIEFKAPLQEGSARLVTLEGLSYGSGTTVVILAHEYPTSQDAWIPFARELAGRGYHAYTFNFRGYGRSEGDRDPSRAGIDLEAVVKQVSDRGAGEIFIVGASMGGTAAILAGGRFTVAGVVVISAPASFRGLDAGAAVGSRPSGEPLLLVAAEDDPAGAAASARALFAAAGEPKRLEIVPGAREHGSELLYRSHGKRVKELIFDFLSEYRR
jgi:alpha-beta hydrolase superfamily lysophospholipase